MNRRKFVSASVLATVGATGSLAAAKGIVPEQAVSGEKELYELREYELEFKANPADLDTYFQLALMPALNRNGVKTVGAFREIGKSEPAKVYLLIVYPTQEDFIRVPEALKADMEFIKASAGYNSLPPEKALFSRYNSSLLLAFDKIPNLVVPSKDNRLLELRTYEGHNEDAVTRKIGMFNKEEIALFYAVHLKPVFYGEMLAGSTMPCLTYMIAFKDMAERDALWADFDSHPEWKRMSQAPEYANTVSRIIRIFLVPAPYSQI